MFSAQIDKFLCLRVLKINYFFQAMIYLFFMVTPGMTMTLAGGPAFLAHTKQKVSNIVDLTVLRLAFFTGYE